MGLIRYCLFLFLLQPQFSWALEEVTLQLRWHHQFQFAGYYAAKQQGYYRDAGYDVTILSGSAKRQPVTEILAGRADFAVGNSEVLLSRLKGQPLVILSAIFQHSPSVLLTVGDSLDHPSKLVNHKVMMVPGGADSDLFAMFKKVGIDVETVDVVDSSYDIDDLIYGRVSAFNSYLTNEPYFLQQKEIAYKAICPIDFGIDFYSDMVFTHEKMVRENPQGVERFRQATIKGWYYALAHPEETIELIKMEYGSSKTIEHLRFEAREVEKLVLIDLLEVGHIHLNRLIKMAEVFQGQGMVENIAALSGFVFIPPVEMSRESFTIIGISVAIASITSLVCILFVILNRKLAKEVRKREAAESRLKLLAETDELTGLFNRRVFLRCLQFEESQFKRYGSEFSLIVLDLDKFKQVNDTYGHAGGDVVLKAVVDCLKDTQRASDISARIGGEEFVLILPKTSAKDALQVAERLREKISQLEITLPNDGQKVIRVTASLGVAGMSETLEENILRCADIALYQAKRNGRNRVELF